MKIRPPEVKESWDDNDWWTQELILAYNAGREIEEAKTVAGLAGVRI